MIDRNKLGIRSGAEKQGCRGAPDAADEILIIDYVMLDFVKELHGRTINGGHESAVAPRLGGDPGEDPLV